MRSEMEQKVNMATTGERIEIAGAGPAGLAAAITLARADRQVLVHELQPDVGHRFKRYFQGLESWSTERDALEQLREIGISTDCACIWCRHGAHDTTGTSAACGQ
jgi:2-polyprenyl-6-methoxyphenol hydroxylase-like FAD-dependent oxidoreductase